MLFSEIHDSVVREAALRCMVAAQEQTLEAWRMIAGATTGQDETSPVARLRRIAVQLSDLMGELHVLSRSYDDGSEPGGEDALEAAAGNIDVALDEIDAAIRWLERDGDD